MSNQIFKKKKFINLGGELVSLEKPWAMGILNITEDSFFDGGRYNQQGKALLQVEQMLKEGADIIDIGAQSTRPGAKMLGKEEEMRKLIPMLKAIVKEFPDTKLSVDTFYAEVAQQAVRESAHMINDISGGNYDKEMFAAIAQLKVPYVLMHTQGRPESMQHDPQYENVVAEVMKTLSTGVSNLESHGIADIIVDPGFGFGKNLEHNYTLLNSLKHFTFLEKPILVGISRKSMIQKVLDVDAKDALNGTSALHMIALNHGADILRVHDVKEAKQVIKLWEALQSNGKV